jgi:hypothetical protein
VGPSAELRSSRGGDHVKNDSGEHVRRGRSRRLWLIGVEMPTAPEADELDNWAQENYSLSASAAASLGFPVGSLTATVQRDALMFGSSR